MSETVTTTSTGSALDLRGVPCPLNCTRVILAMEDLATGGVLTTILDDGDPVTNVTATLAREGDIILSRTRLADGSWQVEIERHV